MMKVHELAHRLQLAIQSALNELPEDCFARHVERDAPGLIVSVSTPSSSAITGTLRLTFDQESETSVVQTQASSCGCVDAGDGPALSVCEACGQTPLARWQQAPRGTVSRAQRALLRKGRTMILPGSHLTGCEVELIRRGGIAAPVQALPGSSSSGPFAEMRCEQ